MGAPILDIRADEVRDVTAALEQGRCVAVLAPEASGSSSVLQLAMGYLHNKRGRGSAEHVVLPLNLPRGSRLPVQDFFRSTLRHMTRRLRSVAPDVDVRGIMAELYGDAGQSLLPDAHSAALQFEEVLAVLVDEFLIPNNKRLVLVADHLARVSLDHLREFGNIIHRLWEELDGHLVLLTAGSEALYTLCRRGSRDGHFSAFHIAHRVELDDLSPERVERMVQARLALWDRATPSDAELGRMVERIVTLSGGHPRFVDALIERARRDGVEALTRAPLEAIVAELVVEDDHLAACRALITESPNAKAKNAMLGRLDRVLNGPTLSYLDRDAALETLRWNGLIVVRNQQWCPRNLIFRGLIERLLEHNRPSHRASNDPPPLVTPDQEHARVPMAATDTLDQVEIPLFDDRYQLLRPLSSGAFGAIYEARDTLLKTRVALKRLHPHLSSARIVERFRREVVIARRLTHPNIVRVHDLGRAEEAFYYTMEYISGGNLADRFAATQGAERLALVPLLVQLCDGLQALHDAGIVHRDLKPENALIDGDARLKLADFGISVAQDMGRLTGSGAVGTPLYMSPEQASGMDVTVRSDLYAVGLLLYELFSGQTLFQSRDIRAIIANHIHTDPPNIRAISSFVPEEAAVLIHRCLNKEPELRPSSARSIAAVLRKLHVPVAQA